MLLQNIKGVDFSLLNGGKQWIYSDLIQDFDGDDLLALGIGASEDERFLSSTEEIFLGKLKAADGKWVCLV